MYLFNASGTERESENRVLYGDDIPQTITWLWVCHKEKLKTVMGRWSVCL